MRIGNRDIGPGHPPYVIAEIGVNHDGEVARALELTDAAAKAGADAVKLQYFETDRLLSKAAKLAAYQQAAGETDPVAMLRRLELGLDDMALVVERAHALGIHAIVTVFSVELVEPAARLGWDAFKSASPDVVNRPLLEALAGTGRPLIVSTGASTLEEVVRARGWLEGIKDRLAFLQCVSAYPAWESGYGGVKALAETLDVPVGYSDHTQKRHGAGYPVALGACILEKHITDDNRRPGPDHRASLRADRFRSYIESAQWGVYAQPWVGVVPPVDLSSRHHGGAIKAWAGQAPTTDEQQGRFMGWRASKIPVEKIVLDCERDVREVARQSLTTTRPLALGHRIAREDLTIKRPGTGFEPWRLSEVLGRRVARAVEGDVPVCAGDVEGLGGEKGEER